MPAHEPAAAETPRYVLIDGNRRIGPNVVQPLSNDRCAPIYGFSSKDTYDRFRANCPLALTPYPLVTVYLRNEIGAPGQGLRLVVLDAAGPREPCLYAATMDAVLAAQENRTTHVPAAYRLMSDQESSDYTLKAAIALDKLSDTRRDPGSRPRR